MLIKSLLNFVHIAVFPYVFFEVQHCTVKVIILLKKWCYIFVCEKKTVDSFPNYFVKNNVKVCIKSNLLLLMYLDGGHLLIQNVKIDTN